MGFRRMRAIVSGTALALGLLSGMPGTALAGGYCHHGHKGYDPSVGYAVPIQNVYQFPAAIVFQPTLPVGYAVPIQNVYQFPAAIVSQPGASDVFAGPGLVVRPVSGYHDYR